MKEQPGPRHAAPNQVFRKTLAIVAEEDRQQTLYTMLVVIISALFAALIVASILPFLTLLSNPDAATDQPAFVWYANLLGIKNPYSLLIAVGVSSILLIVVGSGIQIWKTYVMERYSARQAYTISHRLLCIYLGKPYTFHLERHSSDLATIVLSEVGEAITLVLRPAIELTAAFLTFVAIIVFLLWAAPVLTIGVVVVVGSLFLLTSMVSRHYLVQLGQERAGANAERFKIVNEGFGGIKEIKVMGLEHRYIEQYDPPTLKMAYALIGMRFISQMPRNVIHAIVSVGVIVVCLVLVPAEDYASDRGLTELVPTLGLFAMAVQRIIPELQKCYGAVSQIQFGIAAIDKLFADFVGVKVPTFEKTGPALPLQNSFELKDVSYTYPFASQPSLRKASLKVSAGETIGIVGTTGAGKTTLADIILGLITPSSGEILVDDTLLTQDNLPRWQKAVGYVPQDIFLTDSTIAENIAFGLDKDEIDLEHLEKSAKIANLHELITTDLSDGYDTLLGERGVRLSGGQRQRVGIARAIYRNAELIVFDEATSALDTLTEKEIMEALPMLPKTKTAVLIAHRLSTLHACNRIIVMQGGRIDDVGTWDELLSRNASFQALVAANELNEPVEPI